MHWDFMVGNTEMNFKLCHRPNQSFLYVKVTIGLFSKKYTCISIGCIIIAMGYVDGPRWGWHKISEGARLYIIYFAQLMETIQVPEHM